MRKIDITIIERETHFAAWVPIDPPGTPKFASDQVKATALERVAKKEIAKHKQLKGFEYEGCEIVRIDGKNVLRAVLKKRKT